MPTPPRFPLRVFYDGACPICATEIAHYVRRDQSGRLTPIDISAADFDPEAYGFSQEAVMQQLHAIDHAGTVYRGVEAFWAIWQAFPPRTIYGLLGRLINLPFINRCARVVYACFARNRQRLSKSRACDHDHCRSGSDHQS